MPLKGRLGVGPVLLASVLGAVAACDPPARKDDHPVLSFAAASSLTSKAPLSGELVATVRAVQDAALAVVSDCFYEYQGIDGVETIFDACAYKKGSAAALHVATEKLLSSRLIPDAGPASSFVQEARMFDAFVAEVDKKHRGEDYNYESQRRRRSRGTLAHYQDLAAAWNAMLPQDPFAVDPIGMRVDAGVRGTIVWERCGGLACFRKKTP